MAAFPRRYVIYIRLHRAAIQVPSLEAFRPLLDKPSRAPCHMAQRDCVRSWTMAGSVTARMSFASGKLSRPA